MGIRPYRFYWRNSNGEWFGADEYYSEEELDNRDPDNGPIDERCVPFTSGVYEGTTEVWFTLDEVAQLLIMKPGTVRKMAQDGHIKVHKFGKLLRFHRRDIDWFIESGGRPSGTQERADEESVERNPE